VCVVEEPAEYDDEFESRIISRIASPVLALRIAPSVLTNRWTKREATEPSRALQMNQESHTGYLAPVTFLRFAAPRE
jgi:hypothetical protein